MRRKVLQDFANTVCQNYIDLTGGHDAAAFACYGSGRAFIDLLSGNCTFNDRPIPALKGGTRLKDWLRKRLAAHNIAVQDIVSAQMTVTVRVSNLKFERWGGHAFYSGFFNFNCESEIKTDEKTYSGQMSGETAWGFMEEDYVALCGQPQEETTNC